MEAWMEGGERDDEGNQPPVPDLSNAKRWIRMPLRELTTYTPGRVCYSPSWWVVHDDCVLFFKGYGSPQCNVDAALAARLWPWAQRLEFIPRAFVPVARQ